MTIGDLKNALNHTAFGIDDDVEIFVGLPDGKNAIPAIRLGSEVKDERLVVYIITQPEKV